MKKKLPLILLLLSLLLIVLGIVGVVSSHRKTNNAEVADQVPTFTQHESSAGTSSPSAGTRVNQPGNNLLGVKTPVHLKEQLKDYTGFTVSFNADNHTPNWVAWELLGTETDGPKGRSNLFWTDDEIEGCPGANDYKRSGFDRGHMCPAADQKWSDAAMEDCFSFANMVPQDHALNAGAWQTLEAKERQWAQRDSAILIVAGPIYEKSDTQRIGDIGVRVPSAFFKVIVAPYLAEPRGIAFIYPNMTSPGNMENYVVTIDEVERITGFDFFHQLPDDVEQAVEATSSFREWNRTRKNR